MIKLVIGALLVATTTLAQTGTKPKATTATKPTSTTTSPAKSKATASTKPLPNPPLKEKLESGDRAIPSYKQEKDAGVHKVKPKYEPRRTKSGARKDTMKSTKL